ncbi:MAG: hypothetical protein ABI333_18490 [bacterium]
MRKFKGVVVAALALVTFVTAGCGFKYKTLRETVYAPQVLQSAQQLYIKPLDFSRVQKTSDYSKQEDWVQDIAKWQSMFATEVNKRATEAGLGARVRTLQPGQPLPTTGVIVQCTITKIIRNYSVMGGGFDHLVTDIRFLNAADNKVLYFAIVESTSKAFGFHHYSIVTRLGMASWNMVTALVSIMKNGRNTPPEG